MCHDRQEVTFYRNKSAYNLYRHSATQPVASARNTEKITVQARNVIADLTEHLGSQAGGAKVEQIYLKMDIEGGEFEIMKNMQTLLQICRQYGAHQCVCILEYSLDIDRNLDNFRQRWHEMSTRCKAVGPP